MHFEAFGVNLAKINESTSDQAVAAERLQSLSVIGFLNSVRSIFTSPASRCIKLSPSQERLVSTLSDKCTCNLSGKPHDPFSVETLMLRPLSLNRNKFAGCFYQQVKGHTNARCNAKLCVCVFIAYSIGNEMRG